MLYMTRRCQAQTDLLFSGSTANIPAQHPVNHIHPVKLPPVFESPILKFRVLDRIYMIAMITAQFKIPNISKGIPFAIFFFYSTKISCLGWRHKCVLS